MRDRRFWVGVSCLAIWGFVGGSVGAADLDVAGRPADARPLTAAIDRYFTEKWLAAKVRVAAPADDAEYLRRVYLDLVGKIPTAAEARDFLDDSATDKRARLVDRLLDSSVYLTRATEIYRAMLLPEAETDAQVRGLAPTFEAWLRKQVSDDIGYDQIVREVLTLKFGGRGRRGSSALDARAEPSPLAYYVAKEAKPENLAANTARVFLGLRLECAQCHNHPFAKWKREEFWGLAAFFAGVSKQGKDDALGSIRELPNVRELTIPGTSKIIRASFLGESKEPNWRSKVGSRDLLAQWVTAPGNPYFARAAVNRVWARFFGIGLIEPFDDMSEAGAESQTELLDEVASRFRDHRYDLKFLIRAVLASRPYGLTSAVGRSEPAPADLFAAMPVRTLSPDQLFDSLAQATGFREGSNAMAFNDNSSRGQFLELFANRDEKATEGQTTILQALALMNGPLISRVTSPLTGDVLAAVTEVPYLDTPGRIETLFLAALSRRPRRDEQEMFTNYVEKRGATDADRAEALADVFWALLNSPEFRFNH